jgi:hypothetical protein
MAVSLAVSLTAFGSSKAVDSADAMRHCPLPLIAAHIGLSP